MGASKSTFFGLGSESGLSCGILVGFGVVVTLQVNANDTFAAYIHVCVCLYVYTIYSVHKTDKSKRDRLFFWREQKTDEIS